MVIGDASVSSYYGMYYFNVTEQNRGYSTTIKNCDTATEVSKLVKRLETGSAKGRTRPLRVEVRQHRVIAILGEPPIDDYSTAQWFDYGEAKYKGILAATGQSSPMRHVSIAKEKMGIARINAGRLINAQASKLAPAAILAFIRSLLGS